MLRKTMLGARDLRHARRRGARAHDRLAYWGGGWHGGWHGGGMAAGVTGPISRLCRPGLCRRLIVPALGLHALWTGAALGQCCY